MIFKIHLIVWSRQMKSHLFNLDWR